MDIHIPTLVQAIPDVVEILQIQEHTNSAWAIAYKITAKHSDGSTQPYFMKVSEGLDGREALKGEFESTYLMYQVSPEFCPKPIAWGTFKASPDSHYYLCRFYEMSEGPPEPESFCAKLARMHSESAQASPDGKFGFHVTTYNGNLPQDNTWVDTWEECFKNGIKHVFSVYRNRAGPSPELEEMLPDFYDKVIPRLLRPLESNGRRVVPALVHGDLWYGNTAITDDDTEEGIVFDPASFWAHNEYELGNWKPPRNMFSRPYFEAYHLHIPKSEPQEDYDDRNALYSLRFNANAATIFPDRIEFLDMVLEEMSRLISKYPEGFQG